MLVAAATSRANHSPTSLLSPYGLIGTVGESSLTRSVSGRPYVAALLGLTFSAWIVVTGTQDVRNLGDVAHFGAVLFQILAPLQLALAIFFSALLAASGVTQEKDRRTLVLLLLTNLTGHPTAVLPGGRGRTPGQVQDTFVPCAGGMAEAADGMIVMVSHGAVLWP